MDEIEQQFIGKGIVRGGVLFLNPTHAVELIDLCEKLNKRILGIDTFILTETETRPVMEHTADYSMNGDNLSGYWNEAREFVSERSSSGFVFEVVYALV